MFFRRVFSRKEHSAPAISRLDLESNTANSSVTCSPKRTIRKSSSDDKRGISVLQLTPVWEHIIRTKSLPDNVCERRIFDEFVERLHDPEWQVRQHALRVLVDVLIVMGPQSDQYFQPILFPLIENLGHAAPAVRKGALDALKVYMTETARIESILLQVIDLGMERRSIQEKYGGRLCVGTMLALPSLVHTCLGSTKQAFVLRTVIDVLTNKMILMPFQEVALKVLLRIREMIGVREFSEYIAHGAYREFELLCNVYGLQSNPDSEIDSYMPVSSDSTNSWQIYSSNTRENHCKIKRTELNWRNDDDELYSDDLLSSSLENGGKYRRLPEICSKPYPTPCPKTSACSQQSCHGAPAVQPCPHSITISSATSDKKCDREKVIMETEIKIQDTPVTMRIVEAENDNECSTSSYTDEDNGSVYEHSGVVRVLTDSELEEVNNNLMENIPRTPKRVTFGGEEVKMRTPDSDSVLQSDNDDLNRMARQLFEPPPKFDIGSDSSSQQQPQQSVKKTERPKTASSSISHTANNSTIDHQPSKVARYTKSASPIRRRQSYSSTGSENMSLSPRATHKGIEVLHNLQRSPNISPNRSRRASPEKERPVESVTLEAAGAGSSTMETTRAAVSIDLAESGMNGSIADGTMTVPVSPATVSEATQTTTQITNTDKTEDNEKKATWETLDLVDDECLRNLKSGDWRLRCNAICTIEEMLKSTENLATVQPRLESLMRTLLSAEKNSEVLEDKRRIIINLITRLPLDNLEDRTSQILIGLCRQGGSGSNRVAKALMQRLPPASVLRKLISDEFLQVRSSKFRENALQMVLYSLMTFPSTHFDISTCVHRTALAANDKKKRVRQAALDVLAVLSQIRSPKAVLEEVMAALRDENDTVRLVPAIKARLSRKQLPTVTADGEVQYALRIATPPSVNSVHLFGADIDWITAGIGSVSPPTIKKRSSKMQIFQNFSSSDSTGSNSIGATTAAESIRKSKPPREILFGAGYRPDNESHSNDNTAVGRNSGGTVQRMTGYQQLNDDKNGHFVIATSIPSSDISSLSNGLKYVQSKSFPDLSKRTAAKNGLVSFMDIGINSNTRTSRLPVASRFPSMEASVESRNGGSRNDTNHIPNHYTASNHMALYKFNNSLPRNFTSTHIPIRNGYSSYSQGAPTYLSSNDDLRPSTHPIENVPPIPKRFINVNRYLGDKTHTDYSSDEPRTHHYYKYKGQANAQRRPDADSGNETPVVNIIRKSVQGLHERELSRHHSASNNNNNSHHHSNSFLEINSASDLSSEDKSVTSTPTRILDENYGIVETYRRNDGRMEQTAVDDPERPKSHLSSATTKSLRDEEDDHNGNSTEKNHDGEDGHSDRASRPKTANTERSRSSSIHEVIYSRAGSPISSRGGDEQEQQVVTDYDIDEEPGLESEEQERRRSMDNADSGVLELEQVATSGDSDMIDGHDQLPEHNIDGEGSQELEDEEEALDNNLNDNDDELADFEGSAIAVTGQRNEYDSGSLTSEESSDQISQNNETYDKESSILEEEIAKPIEKRKRPPMLLRRNRVSDIKIGAAATSTVHAIQKAKAQDLLSVVVLRRFDKPREGLNNCLSQLDSPNWETTMNGLQNFVRLIRFHSELVETNIHTLCVALCKHVRNLRSQVSRSACQACGEFFVTHSKYLEQEIDDLATTLLNRTADTNKFLRADAAKALNAMCDHMPAHKTIQAVVTRGATHPNAIVRTASANLCNRIIDRLGCDKIFTMHRDSRDKLILAGANFMMEGSLETRNHAKLMFRKFSDHPLYSKTILEVIPTRTYRNIEKTLKSIK